MRKIFNSFILFFICLFFPVLLCAQISLIRGKVTDAATSEPLPFVNVGIKGQTAGTFTDGNGNYKFELPFGTYMIVYSSVGYEKLEKTIILDGSHPVSSDIALKPVSHELNTVVI